MFKEQLIGFFDALTNILHGLRTYQLPKWIAFSQFGNVTLKLSTTQVFIPHSIVSFVESDSVIVDNSSSVDCLLEISIPLVAVELEIQCLHAVHANIDCR
jgi:hypothetical protein